ncbi:MAG: alpha/beta hydrolase [Archangium sp.]|nr:alpha/beta hydrolase [Archangium sp.]
MGIALSVVAATVLGLAGLLLFWSYPGQPAAFLDANGQPLPNSISEKVFVEINGTRQGMFLRGKDRTRPVLLYLHGGLPEYFLAERHEPVLEELFVVCWWEQRGAGLSNTPGLDPKAITTDQFIADTIEVTQYLRRRFGQERIFLLGHSGGSFLGVLAAARAPELFRAYVGVAQMANQLASETRAFDSMLEQFRQRGDTRMVQKLEAAPVTLTGGFPGAYAAVRDEAMHKLGGGTTHQMKSVVSGIFLPSLRSPAYSLGEKLRLWRGKAAAGVSPMFDEMLTTNLAARVPELRVPVYFLHGAFDYTCTSAEAEAYFDGLKAPLKGFYRFPESAHSPMLEEPARFRRVLNDVLSGTNDLADKR